MDGLIIYKRWCDLIFSGKKRLEIRGCDCKKHEGKFIAIIQAKSSSVVGICKIMSIIRLTKNELLHDNFLKWHRIPKDEVEKIKYKRIFAYCLTDVIKFNKKIPYIHPQGAQQWVKNVL